MPGVHVNQKQVNLYMEQRNKGLSQASAAAKAGFSERTGRRIENQPPRTKSIRQYRTRKDPLDGLFEREVIPLLQKKSTLQPTTIFEYLAQTYPDKIQQSHLRTLQRRIRAWHALSGSDKEVMFEQQHLAGELGICDYTLLKNIVITIDGVPFCHRLFHYRLVFSKHCYVMVVQGGESYESLATGLTKAFDACQGVPSEIRTDSLSAAFKNKPDKEALTERYHAFCQHYGVRASRNTPGKAHENGAIEASHGHLKNRIVQQLTLRGSHDFASISEYQDFIDLIVATINQKQQAKFELEQQVLKALPAKSPVTWREEVVSVSSHSTIRLLRVLYTVPSRLIGRKLVAYLYTDHIDLYYNSQKTYALKRTYAPGNERAKHVDYKHVIHSLIKKPNAFKGSTLREAMIPEGDWTLAWQAMTADGVTDQACLQMVRLLHLAASADCESALGSELLRQLEKQGFVDVDACRKKFATISPAPEIETKQHDLRSYDALVGGQYV